MSKHFFIVVILISTTIFSVSGQGSTYNGSYINSAPIVWSGISNKTISGLSISNSSGNCIELLNCSNITVQNCKFSHAKGEGLHIYNCTNIQIINCSFDSVASALYAGESTGIKFNYNDVKNVIGPMPRGQMCQFDHVTGGGNSISYNAGENISGQSNPEDEISLYNSNGLAADPILIESNWIRGGGPSNSGGGIMTGDNGGSYIVVRNNVLVNPGQYGIAIASGNNITIENNKVFSEQLPFSNVGIYAFNQYPSDCSSNTVINNTINFTYKDGRVNNLYTNGTCGSVTGWNQNPYDPDMDSSILPAQIIGRAKSSANSSGVTTGVTTSPSQDKKKMVKIYPNPAGDQLSIQLPEGIDNSTMTIYQLNGQRLLEENIGSNNALINTSTLTNGIYIIKVSSNGTLLESTRLIIQH